MVSDSQMSFAGQSSEQVHNELCLHKSSLSLAHIQRCRKACPGLESCWSPGSLVQEARDPFFPGGTTGAHRGLWRSFGSKLMAGLGLAVLVAGETGGWWPCGGS
jgi:hypothetical protein